MRTWVYAKRTKMPLSALGIHFVRWVYKGGKQTLVLRTWLIFKHLYGHKAYPYPSSVSGFDPQATLKKKEAICEFSREFGVVLEEEEEEEEEECGVKILEWSAL